MKTQILLTQASLLVVMALFGVACAKKTDAPADAPAGTTGVTPVTTTTLVPGAPTDGDIARGAAWLEGATAPLIQDSLSVLNNYVSLHPVNNPTDLRISVKTYDVGSGQFAGKVMVSYLDNGQYYTASFNTNNEVIPSGYSHGHDGQNHAAYNKWFTKSAKSVFHGFFADDYGAVMLIVDGSIDQGDGGGASEYTGEIWYKNYSVSRAGQGFIPCQFVEIGPYDCRTFLTDSETLTTTSVLYPSQSTYGGARGWQRLGRFSGLAAGRAFGTN